MSSEVWLPIPGYEKTYEVSSIGRVNSKPRRRTRGGIRKQSIGKRGYPQLSLVQDGVQTTHEVHRLVALAFLGPRPDGMEVRHIDGDSTNPRVENLSYGSRSENARDMLAHGTHVNAKKTHCNYGHAFDEQNTCVIPSRPNARYCRACTKLRRQGSAGISGGSSSTGFNLEEFEAGLEGMNGGVVLRTSSTDETFHVITYVRDRSSSRYGVRPLFTTRIFRDGVVPDHLLDEFASEDQALEVHSELVEQFMDAYNTGASCLLEGAL